MPALRIVSTQSRAVAMRVDMDTQDPPTDRAEGMYIGDALQRLAAELNIESARQFALRFGIHYKHLVNLWGNKRRAGLVTVTEIARKTGRAVAFFFGEMQALPVLGSMDTMGRITMSTTEINAGLIHLPEACGVFVAGSRLVLEPSTHRDQAWLVVRSRDTGATWIGWSHEHHALPLLTRTNGEAVVYSETAHEILGAIVDVLVPPPRGRLLSADIFLLTLSAVCIHTAPRDPHERHHDSAHVRHLTPDLPMRPTLGLSGLRSG